MHEETDTSLQMVRGARSTLQYVQTEHPDGQTEGQQLLTQTHPLTRTPFSCLTRTTQNLNPKMLRALRIQENLLFASVKTLVTYFYLLL